MDNFDKWDSLFRAQDLFPFNQNKNGILWLKVRAICRSKQISQFLEENGLSLSSTKISSKNRELFELLENRADSDSMLNSYLQNLNHEWYENLNIDKDKLKENLYQVQSYSWGGDQKNSLDKYLVSHFVKTIDSFSELERRKGEIAANAWNYVQNSWYNNWTSFLIESLFKQNRRVISAVGEIKSVDFFIDDFPIDLKVTFFPNQFMEEKLKGVLGKSKISWLKNKAKDIGIAVDSSIPVSRQVYILKEKLFESGNTDILDELKSAEQKVIYGSQENSIELMTWLYENQGEMRFGAENRIYLILANTDSLEDSWKLKRAIDQLEPIVNEYIKSFTQDSLTKIDFTFKKQRFQALSDVIFFIR